MTDALIAWRNGRKRFANSGLDDARVNGFLDRLAEHRARDVTLDFVDEHEHEWIDVSTMQDRPRSKFECGVEGCGEKREL